MIVFHKIRFKSFPNIRKIFIIFVTYNKTSKCVIKYLFAGQTSLKFFKAIPVFIRTNPYYLNPLDTVTGSPLDPGQYVFVAFLQLLKIFRQWYLLKFLILGELSTYLLGLTFPCLTSEKMRVGVQRTSLSSIKVAFFKTFFLKKKFKKIAQALFIYFVFLHPQALFRQLGPSFLG